MKYSSKILIRIRCDFWKITKQYFQEYWYLIIYAFSRAFVKSKDVTYLETV